MLVTASSILPSFVYRSLNGIYKNRNVFINVFLLKSSSFLYTCISPVSSSTLAALGVDGVLGGVLGDDLGGSRVISKQLPSLMCVHRESRIPAMMPTMAELHAAIMSVKSVALYCIDGGNDVAICWIISFLF